MRIWRNEDETPSTAWARAGVVMTAVATLALALALTVMTVRGLTAGR